MSGDYETHKNQQPHVSYAGNKVDLDKYALFVDGVTSDPSKDYQSFLESLSTLDGEGSNIHRLLTAAVGISAEGGEFMEIVKKMVFQGKPWNHDNREHLIIELGDVMWYVMQACKALHVSLDEVIEGKTLTTPSVLNTYRHIYQAVTAGCDYFVMEVSSHAIVQKRIEGIPFALKILTNITQDHLDYHKDLQSYIAVKNSFFQDEGLKLINKDEPKAAFVIDNTYTYGIENPASYKIMAYTLNDGISAILQHFNQVGPIHSPLYGFFNLYNITAAVGAVHLLTQRSLEEVCEAVDNFAGVSGRMEVVSQQPAVLVDFAHTPDGMQQVLNSLKEKDLLVVFGAGGDRDRVKRPLMGRIAATLAKRVYVTSDNPRTEDPDAIIADILEGIEDRSTVHVDVNRRASIARALQDQQEGEVVVILGKGDETHQVIYDKKLPFDDREIVRELLAIQ